MPKADILLSPRVSLTHAASTSTIGVVRAFRAFGRSNAAQAIPASVEKRISSGNCESVALQKGLSNILGEATCFEIWVMAGKLRCLAVFLLLRWGSSRLSSR